MPARIDSNPIRWPLTSQSPFIAPPLLAVIKNRQLRVLLSVPVWAEGAGSGEVLAEVPTHFFGSARQLRAGGVEGESSQRPVVGRDGAGCFL